MSRPASRTVPGDWYPGGIPSGADVDPTACVETSHSFRDFRSRAVPGLRIGRGASVYGGMLFDVGPEGSVDLGEYAMLNGGRIVCDARIEIGAYALLAWNVVLMDTYRVSFDAPARRRELARVARRRHRVVHGSVDPRPVRIGAHAWIGFDVCILPGVTIGEGAIVGARSVVTQEVPPYMIAAGNPARILRAVGPEDARARGGQS